MQETTSTYYPHYLSDGRKFEGLSDVVSEVKDWTVNHKRGECWSIHSCFTVRDFDEDIARLKGLWFNHSTNALTVSESRKILSRRGRENPLHEDIFQIAIHLNSDERATKYMIAEERFNRAMQVGTRASMEALLFALKDAEWLRYVACLYPDHPRRPLIRIFADRCVSDAKNAKNINRPSLKRLSVDGVSVSMRDVMSKAFTSAFREAILTTPLGENGHIGSV